MRDHATIIREAGGPAKVARGLHDRLGGSIAGLQYRVRGWVQQSSIPGEYWGLLSDLGVASLDELATAAARRRFGDAGVAA